MLEIVKNNNDVRIRLSDLGLTEKQIITIAKKAIAGKFNAVPNHPVNAAGLLAYIEGVKAMRDETVSQGNWDKKTENGIEFVVSNENGNRLIYQNVDFACDPHHDPQPISKRGGEGKREAISSNQMSFPEMAKKQTQTQTNTWVICVSENNGFINAELSMPGKITKSGLFTDFIERIFVLQNSDVEFDQSEDTETMNDEFDISLKKDERL